MERIYTNSEKIENKKILWKMEDMNVISNSANYMEPIFQDIQKSNKIHSILDVGCGNGHFTTYFKKQNVNITGIDGSKFGLIEALENGFDECYLVDNIDYDDINLQNKKFDLIICKDFLEHILFPEKLLSKLANMLNPEGKILLMVPNHFPLYFRIKFLFTNNIDTQNFFPDCSEWNFPHIRFYTDNGMKKLFKKLNLEITKNYSHYFLFFIPRGISLLKKINFFNFLTKKYPSQFSTAFCYLLKSNQTSN